MHVLLLCNHFPPLNRTGARRPYYLACALRDLGHRVSVATSAGHGDDDWTADLGGLRILRIPTSWTLRHSPSWQRSLAKLERIAQGSLFGGPLRVLADLVLPLDHRDRWDISVKELETSFGKADVVLATIPGWSIAQFGMQAAAAWNATFLLDYRDPWSIADPKLHMNVMSNFGKGFAGAVRRWSMRRHERRVGRSAFALSAVSKPVLENARRITGNDRGAVFMGGYPPGAPPPMAHANTVFTLTYTGRLYAEQDWDLVLEGMARLGSIHHPLHHVFQLKLVGPVCNEPRLLERVQRFGQEQPALQLMPRLGREEALQEQHRADALLHLAYRGRKGYMPVKFLEYLNAGRPILLVSQEDDLMEDLLARTRTGTVLRNSVQFTQTISAMLADRQAGRPLPYRPDQDFLGSLAYPERMRPWVQQIRAWHDEHRRLAAPAAERTA